MTNLNTSDPYILYGDYYHLFNEVCPKSENFSSKCFTLIKEYLRSTLESNTLEKWNIADNFAKDIMRPFPKQFGIVK